MAISRQSGKVTPPRITRLVGYGSPLWGALGNGPPRGGRHQPEMSRLPTENVNYTKKAHKKLFKDERLLEKDTHGFSIIFLTL